MQICKLTFVQTNPSSVLYSGLCTKKNNTDAYKFLRVSKVTISNQSCDHFYSGMNPSNFLFLFVYCFCCSLFVVCLLLVLLYLFSVFIVVVAVLLFLLTERGLKTGRFNAEWSRDSSSLLLFTLSIPYCVSQTLPIPYCVSQTCIEPGTHDKFIFF